MRVKSWIFWLAVLVSGLGGGVAAGVAIIILRDGL